HRRPSMKRFATFLIALVLLGATQDAAAFDRRSDEDSSQTFVHFFSLPIDTALASPAPMRETRDTSGIVVIDYAYGKGDPVTPGKRHFIRFIGCRRNGEIFDTTYSGTKLFSFVLGNNELLKGLEMGLRDMKCGARRQVFIPGRLAYGENGFPSVGIGKNEMLIFYVELVKVE
ncbi:MAG: FKBP-type peptidyl-prolyl cis-trans isomerase, partial [Candidatus Kapaibacterium sp.]